MSYTVSIILGLAIIGIILVVLIVWITFPFRMLALMREQNELLKQIANHNKQSTVENQSKYYYADNLPTNEPEQ